MKKLKTIKEKFIEAYKENGWFIAIDDQEPILDFIISELQARDKEWLEAIGEKEPDRPQRGSSLDYNFGVEIRNKLRKKILEKMKVKI